MPVGRTTTGQTINMVLPNTDDDDEEESENEQESEGSEAEDIEETVADEEIEEEVTEDGGEGEEDEDDEEVETETVDRPEDDEDVDGGEDGSVGGILSKSTLGVSNKIWLLAGVVAVIVVLILLNQDFESTTKDYTEQEVEQEVSEGSEGKSTPDTNRSAGGSEEFDERNQQAAIDEVFG
jgi:hypothetical protein